VSIAAFDPLHVFKVPLPLPLQPYVREAATLCDGGYDPMWQVPLALLPAAVSLGEASGDALSGEALPPQGLVSDMTKGPDTSLSGLEWSYVGSSNPNPNPSSTPNTNPSPSPHPNPNKVLRGRRPRPLRCRVASGGLHTLTLPLPLP